MRSEAKQHFKAPGSAALPAGVRDLHDLLNDYVRLKEQEGQRLALAARNPLAARMQQLMDWEGAQAQAQGGDAAYAGLFGAHAAMPAAYAGMPQLAPLSGAAADGEPDDGDEEGQQGATPSRHRKGAPRKRRRGADPAAALGSAGMASLFGGGAWSPQDLLNLPLDASGLEALLDDGPLQVRCWRAAGCWVPHAGSLAGRPGLPADALPAAALPLPSRCSKCLPSIWPSTSTPPPDTRTRCIRGWAAAARSLTPP